VQGNDDGGATVVQTDGMGTVMPVTSSTHWISGSGLGGAVYVTEQHVISDGSVETMEYGPVPANHDFVAIRTARAAMLDEQLQRQEFEELVRGA
jgi:hypothetical protein